MIALFSLSGAPGVTTLSLALASVWPDSDPVRVVEADASGGDVAVRWGLPTYPGLLEVAAAARPGQDLEPLTDGVQVLPGGLRVCVAPPTAERTAGALELLAHNPKALNGRGRGGTVVDLGRVASGSVSSTLLAAADVAVLVVSGEAAHLKRVREAAGDLFVHTPRVGLAVVGAERSAAEITQAVGLPVWARVPHDPKTARFLAGQGEVRRVHRRPLIKAARALAEHLHSHTARASEPSLGEVR